LKGISHDDIVLEHANVYFMRDDLFANAVPHARIFYREDGGYAFLRNVISHKPTRRHILEDGILQNLNYFGDLMINILCRQVPQLDEH
jgi:hypothetical protein